MFSSKSNTQHSSSIRGKNNAGKNATATIGKNTLLPSSGQKDYRLFSIGRPFLESIPDIFIDFGRSSGLLLSALSSHATMTLHSDVTDWTSNSRAYSSGTAPDSHRLPFSHPTG
jgi:hypothetical protein